jgi:apurinic endonuclease APN1
MTFASSPRSLSVKNLDPETIKNYQQKKSSLNIGPHFFHGVYLVNLASPSKDYLQASINSLIHYQKIAGEIDAVGTIFHLGSSKNSQTPEITSQIVAALNYILDSSPKSTRLIIENAAGQGDTVGKSFDEFSSIIERIGDKSKIGFCLDTQHLFASGILLSQALDKFDKKVGLKHLASIHVNDSKTEFGSKVDRHENLFQGKIPRSELSALLNDTRLKHIPLIMEVPGSGEGPRKSDIDDLKSLLLE